VWDFRVWLASPSSGKLVYKEETFAALSRFERPCGNGCLFVFSSQSLGFGSKAEGLQPLYFLPLGL
jgi:hypothetical protein